MKPRFLIAASGVIVLFVVASTAGRWSLFGVGLAACAASGVINARANRRLRSAVEEKSRQLRQQDFDKLAAIAGAEGEHTEFTTTGSIGVLVDRSGPDTLKVVVRGSADVLFYTLLRFDGFHTTQDGRVWPMSRSEYSALE